jgi:hypothetical protein
MPHAADAMAVENTAKRLNYRVSPEIGLLILGHAPIVKGTALS